MKQIENTFIHFPLGNPEIVTLIAERLYSIRLHHILQPTPTHFALVDPLADHLDPRPSTYYRRKASIFNTAKNGSTWTLAQASLFDLLTQSEEVFHSKLSNCVRPLRNQG